MSHRILVPALAAALLTAAPAAADRGKPAPAERKNAGSNLTISAPADLAPLRGKLQHKGDITIINYTGTDLSGLETLASIEGRLTIFSNPELRSLKGLEGLEVVRGRVTIMENPKLETLGDLAKLRQVEKGVEIESNASLARLMPKPLTLGEPIHGIKGFISIAKNRKLGDAVARSYVDSCVFRGGEAWIKRAEDNGPASR